MSFSQFTEQDYAVINADYARLRESAQKRCSSDKELNVIQQAFEFANSAHKNVRRRSGEPYMLHPIAVAQIVVDDIGLGYKSIAAALLHDVVEDTNYTVQDISNLFGEKIASLVDGLTKIKNVLDKEDKTKMNNIQVESMQAENFKKILLTLNDDVRVVLIKLADRLHNCRTIEFMPEYKRDKILSETMFIFIPLAHRLGLYEVKSELENIWLRYKEPEAYKSIAAKTQEDAEQRKNEIREFIVPIEEKLKAAGFKFEVKMRVKTPYSIWHKIQTKNVPFEQIYDLYAIRIIFEPNEKMSLENNAESERDICYHIFSIITGLYRYKPDRVRDWVKHPKGNGYEALHCTLMSQAGIWIEVQIRSRRMDDIAEKGIAAHWAYKSDGYISENDSEMDKWLAKVKQILVNPDVNALELLDIIHKDLTSAEIQVFTHTGEQKSVQKGSTVLDFAYQIHTEIGNKAIAAKVNMKLVPLTYVLKVGDQIEVITAQNAAPKREWMQFLATRHAKKIVFDYFKANCKDETIEIGKKVFTSNLSQLGFKPTNDVMRKVLEGYKIREGVDDLYFRFGLGNINPALLTEFLGKNEEKKSFFSSFSSFAFGFGSKKSDDKKKEEFIINGKDHKYVIASCCNPIPGDSVIGFKSPSGVITVHKKSCSIGESIAAKHGDWVVTPKWEESAAVHSFPVRISLKGIDRVGLVNEISRYISLVMGINMKKIYLGVDDTVFEGYIELFVHDKDALEQMMKKLSTIDGIQSVVRSDI